MRFLIKLSQLIMMGFTLAACTGANPSYMEPVLNPNLVDQTPLASESIRETSAVITGTLEQNPQLLGEITPTPAGDISSLPTGALEATPSRIQYQLDAILDYTNHHLQVGQSILYTNPSRDMLEDLLLLVEPSRYPGVFDLHSLTWGDGGSADFERNIGWMRVALPQPLPPGGQVQLDLVYELNLPSPDASFYGRPVPFGYSRQQTNLVDWYPFLPPYIDGQGWLSHQAGFFGEHLVYPVADFEVAIQLTRPNPDLVIAASAPAEADGHTYRYHHPQARNFVWSVSHMYQIAEQQVGAVTVLSYAFPHHAQAGEATLQTTAQALALYTELFGPYPHQTLSVVEADFLDGMEYDGLYFLSNAFYNLYGGTPGEYLVAIAAHETAHQWFYALVGNDQALEPWLDEALCTYSERLYFEHTFPEALDWWYQYRVNYYQPRGWVDGTIYNPDGYRAYRDAIYLNGALFLEDLRHLMGDEAFFTFLQDYTRQYSHALATGADFFNLVTNHTQSDLTPLLEEYFSTGYQ